MAHHGKFWNNKEFEPVLWGSDINVRNLKTYRNLPTNEGGHDFNSKDVNIGVIILIEDLDSVQDVQFDEK